MKEVAWMPPFPIMTWMSCMGNKGLLLLLARQKQDTA